MVHTMALIMKGREFHSQCAQCPGGPMSYSTSFFGPYFQVVSFLSVQPVWANRAKVYPPPPLGGWEVGGWVEWCVGGWVGGWVPKQ